MIKQKVITARGEVTLQISYENENQKCKSILPCLYANADLVIFVYDITRAESFDSVRQWIGNLKEKVIILASAFSCSLRGYLTEKLYYKRTSV
jgi:GTPase SAR1 family protein